MPSPLVSVITPTLNADTFLEETIETVLAQTYEPIEHLIADGGSTDRTLEIAERFERKHPDRIRIVSEPGSHTWALRNKGLRESRGDLVCPLDADDLWHPEKTVRQVALMEARPELGFSYTHFEAFDAASGDRLEWLDDSHDWEGDLLVPLWVKASFIGTLTLMWRRDALTDRAVRMGHEDADFGGDRQFGDDQWILLAVSVDRPGARIPERLGRFRRYPASFSARFTKAQNPHVAYVEMSRLFVKEYPGARERLGEWLDIGIARHHARAADYELNLGRRWRARAHRLRARMLDRRGLLPEDELDSMMAELDGVELNRSG